MDAVKILKSIVQIQTAYHKHLHSHHFHILVGDKKIRVSFSAKDLGPYLTHRSPEGLTSIGDTSGKSETTMVCRNAPTVLKPG